MAPPLAAAVLLNHFFIVPTPETYEALRQSAFLRESFAVFEARTTVRQDLTYTGIYFYGDHTYFEFLPPGPGFAEAQSGVAFGVEESGAGARLRARLEEGLGVKVGEMGITRQAEGKDVPWFRMVAAQTGQGMGRFATWTMEYEGSFLDQWFPDLPPRGRGIARAAVLDRYVAKVGPPDARASRLLEDVTALRLALDLRYETHRSGNAEVGLEQHLLELLQRALNRAGARDRGDIGQRDIFYFGPQRTGRYITRAPKYSAWHWLDRIDGEKKPGQ